MTPVRAALAACVLGPLLGAARAESLHCPGGGANRHLIDAALLAAIPPHAFLINTARGDVVDEAALVDALQHGRIAGAGLDVYENEPQLHPGLLTLDNVVLLPTSAAPRARPARRWACAWWTTWSPSSTASGRPTR